MQSFPGIIKRRSPSASRPPANYRLAYANDYYEAWRRVGSARVVEHIGLQRLHRATDRPLCRRVEALASRARPGDRLVAAARPRTALLDPLRAGLRPRLWVPNTNAPGTVVPVSPGEMRVQRRTGGGRYRVWIRGSFGRATSAFVDGREVGAADEVNTPGQWVEVGELQLSPGEHEIVLARPDSKLGPGDAYRGELGPVALEPERPAEARHRSAGAGVASVRPGMGLDRADSPVTGLDNTGERLVPDEQHGEVVHAEHLVRYLVAAELADSRRVLDAACGEGYGTAMLHAAGARSATGVDVDERTVAHARARHPGPEFVAADVRELPFDDASFDLVVCFETIEHVAGPDGVLAELRRVMTDDGVLLVSTPNKHEYLVHNEFHDRELFHEEFVALLQARFERVEILLQHNWLTSAVLPPSLSREASGDEPFELRLRKVVGIEPGAELYTLALCGSRQLPELRPAGVLSGVDEAHRLARRLVEAERSAKQWHDEYRSAEQSLLDLYGSVWWRMTEPLRRLVGWMRSRVG